MEEVLTNSVPLTFREAASGILGSISLACWIFLLVPQLIENYRCGSAEAISITFLLVWFLGDLTNLIGALWAHLVPVVIAIAVYFCIADGVLISQCVYYNIQNARRAARYRRLSSTVSDTPDPTTPLLSRRMSENTGLPGSRRRSSASLRRMSSHRSAVQRRDSLAKILEETEPRSVWLKNISSVLGICATGVVGWAIAWQTGVWKPVAQTGPERSGEVALGATILGYISAICYLGARIPQIIKNYREKSCEGLSLLFFLFSLLGNASYGAGILFHSTEKEYFITNLPWLIGSLGTMVEDVTIFVQFRIYANPNGSSAIV
ncbi:vacuolar membrane PQ loop repeat protein [Coccidioides immitis RS]|uniref:Vacuolar membrane PQ loop repeat protein n=1 Tax=Coccidioides immitis (strain RS) TaxID=246410 RepID=A0A0E1RYM9_COCIM|nr:vacuolar membrane PQ loop repeat protein [Coccidioides immitis RS]EAS32995.2 vacuolar membrane PQ loop repeat protein [Coccidioides immitis RS]